MSTVSALSSSGVLGIQKGLEGLQRDAAHIASAKQLNHASANDLPKSLVNLKLDKLQVQASTQVVKAADEMIGTLLDEFV